MSMNTNAQIVWNFLKSKGCNDVAAAAIMGNLEQESHFDPKCIQNSGDSGRGICQWTYSGRWQSVIKYAREIGKSEWDLNVQLDYMWKEIHEGYLNGFKNHGLPFSTLMKSNDIGKATQVFEVVYEGAGTPAMSDRIKYANQWYTKYKGTGQGAVIAPTPTPTDTPKKPEDGAASERFYKYFESKYLNISDELSVLMMDELIKVDPSRRLDPPLKEDYISYGHRSYSTIYNLTLGDCSFIIPPEFINISSESNSQSIVTLRQENTQKIKNGYSKRTIIIDLVFHGVNQINGYKVEGPGGWYHVDGLRQLFAQFKCTPFLPIENFTINYTYNIHTVALQSIVCSTVEGFPDMITANIVLQEVDLYPYIEAHTMFFNNFIDWDLFRFYYQRQLTETHEYGKLQSIPTNKSLNKFKISILDESVFDSTTKYELEDSFYDIVFDKKIVRTIEENNKKITAKSNWVPYIDSSSSNVHIGAFQCGYSNILTNIQMAENSHPTIQYMGGMDTNFNIVFETNDENVITALEQCNTKNNSIIRNHRDSTAIGFIKIESELVELCGARFVIIDNVVTSTIPGQPGLYNVQISCVSFDVFQKYKEGINGMNPFKDDIDGTKEDAIQQSPTGLKNKVQQDLCVENKLRTRTELYPDLKLPTYKEVDDIVVKIADFRNAHSLSKYPLTNRYPRTPQRMLHGISEVTNMEVDKNGFVTNVPEVIESSAWYDGFVDPDFYMFYPDTYKGMMDDTKEERDELGIVYNNTGRKASARTADVSYSSFGSDISTDSDISNFDYEAGVNGSTELQAHFIALAKKKIGATYSNAHRLGPHSYDCSGLISKCLMQMGIISNSFTTGVVDDLIKAGVLSQKYKVSSTKKYNELIAHAVPGDLLHIFGKERGTDMGHIAIYIGNGKIIHASSSHNRVLEANVSDVACFLRVLEVTKLVKGAKSSVASKKVTMKTETSVNFNLKKGDNGTDVKELQELLNKIDNAGLEVDGDYGSLTKEAVKLFQKNNGLTVTGEVNTKTCSMLNKVANKGLDKTSIKTSVASGKDAKYITKLELERIARTIANIQYGKPYSGHIALAQLIYDRLMNSNNGNLNHILESKIFKGECTKSIKGSSAYKAAENVFCNGERAYPYKMKTFLGLSSGNVDYLAMDNKYDRLGNINELTFWGDKKKKTSQKKFELIAEEITNKQTVSSPGVENKVKFDIGASDLDVAFSKFFGKPVVVNTGKMDSDGGWIKYHFTGNQESRYQKNYNTPEQILMSSFVNQCEYSGKGRLVKAFPSYLFCIVDDDGNWLDGRKLWSNYYALRSLVEIDVVNYNDSPINTATISVTNSYGNLDTLQPNSFYYSPQNDDEYNWVQQQIYRNFGLLIGFGPKLTNDIVKRKNTIFKSMIIQAGSRMHLRMGYGSDPLSLPVVMNGYISDLSVGDITTFVCVSDGVELTNAVISDNPKDVNGIFESQESSNIFMDIMAKRQSWMNNVNKKWGEPNKYGIEHFGLYFSQHFDVPDWTTDMFGENTVPQWLVDGMNAFQGVGETVLTAGKLIGDGFFKGWKTVQYDLVKNIYRSSYDGSLAMYSPFAGFFDGEKNLCFSMYNKTPWDAMQMAVQNAPEYIGMPLYHQFDSRIFLGLPYFLSKYRYNIINGEMYEEAKTFSQAHFIDSLTDIIDNQMLTTTRDVYTNAIVMYTLGKSPTATPTLYSDKTIDFCKQSTKIFDSSVSQNILGPDKLWEVLGADMGKEGACRVGISQLLYNWEKAYQGDILLLGDAGINPCDYLYINDRFNQLTGLCTARTVTHKLSANTGFITTVTPGMIGFSTMENSQAQIVLTNIISVGTAFSYYMGIKKSIKETSEQMSQWYNTSKFLANMQKGVNIGGGLLALGTISKLVKNRKVAKDIYNALKVADYVKIGDELKDFGKGIRTTVSATKFLKWGSKADDAIGVFKSSKTIIGLGKVALSGGIKELGAELGTCVSPLIGTLIGFVIGTLLDILFTAVIDFFRWNNCVVLLPMQHKNSSYIAINKAEKLLITGSLTSEDAAIEDKVSGASTKENDPGTATNMSKQSANAYEKK